MEREVWTPHLIYSHRPRARWRVGWWMETWSDPTEMREGTQMDRNPSFMPWDFQGIPLHALHKTSLWPPQRPLSQVTACPGTGQAVWEGHKGEELLVISHYQIKMMDLENHLTGCDSHRSTHVRLTMLWGIESIWGHPNWNSWRERTHARTHTHTHTHRKCTKSSWW